MRTQRSRALSLTAVGAAVMLTGCTATHASAIRVNTDGSIDYVTCVSDAEDWYAVMHESQDEQNSLDLQPTEELSASSEGSVVHFSPSDREWYSLSIGASYFSSVTVHSDSYTPDEWHWNTDEWFHTGDRCSIDE